MGTDWGVSPWRGDARDRPGPGEGMLSMPTSQKRGAEQSVKQIFGGMGPRMGGEWEMLPRRPRRLGGFWGRMTGGPVHREGGCCLEDP